MKLQDVITKKQKELDILFKKKGRNNRAITKRWRDKFVDMNRKKNYIDPYPTELGFKELKKYNIEYKEEGFNPKRELFYINKGIQYEPKECFCMICHSHNTTAFVEHGFMSRYATCPKHVDFLLIGDSLRKVQLSKK